jgi:hypothetical protein
VQISGNPDNLALQKSSPKNRFSLSEKNLYQQAVLGDMHNKASKCICTSNVVYLLTPCLLLHPLSGTKYPDNTEEGPDTLNQRRKEISRWNIPPISYTA